MTGKIVLAIIIFIVIGAIINILCEPKQQKIERVKINQQTIKSIPLTHIDGLTGYGSGVKVKMSKNIDTITIDETYSIPTKNIESTLFNSSKQLTQHQKSVIKRAVVGGVLLGPLGAIVGSISGVGTQEETKTVWLVTINYKEYGDKRIATFSTDDESAFFKLKTSLDGYIKEPILI